MLLQYILFVFVIIANFVLGFIVLARKYNKLSGLMFGIAIVSISLWAVGDMLLLGARQLQVANVGAYLFYISPMTIPVNLWLFSMIFPEESKLKLGPFLFGLISFVALGFVILFNLHWLISGITITNRLNIATPRTPGFLVYSAYLGLFFFLTYLSLFKKIFKVRGRAKLQLVYIMFGAVLAGLPALVTNLLLPLMGTHTLIWLGPIFSLMSVYCVMIAMVRHRMFDIRWLFARSLGYILSLTVLAGSYALIVFFAITRIFRLDVSGAAQVFISVATALSAMTFTSMKRFFDSATNRIFFRDAYDPQEFIRQLNGAIVSTVELDPLLAQAIDILNHNLKSEYCLFGLKETEHIGQRIIGSHHMEFTAAEISTVRRATVRSRDVVIITEEIAESAPSLHTVLRAHDIEVLARLTTSLKPGVEGIGYIILGPKRSGNPYNAQDTKMIGIIANELVIAIQNAMRFEEIERFNQTLQERVEEATRKLRASNEKLKKLDETKDDFISMASHQLRTPLTSVKGYVSMVLDGDAGQISELQRKLLTQSFLSAQRMVYLISDLLNVSRLKTGKFVIEPVPSNLSKVIGEEVEQLVETVKARKLELNFHKPEHFPTLMLDETKLRQVIMNFIDNAIYYTPSGGHIDVYLVDKPDSIEFTVVDDGIGVPKDEQHHLFSKFYRAKNAKRARPDGTGLGIFMAKKVIIAQGGAVIFRSTEGKGSTFGFMFAKRKLQPAPGQPDSATAKQTA